MAFELWHRLALFAPLISFASGSVCLSALARIARKKINSFLLFGTARYGNRTLGLTTHLIPPRQHTNTTLTRSLLADGQASRLGSFDQPNTTVIKTGIFSYHHQSKTQHRTTTSTPPLFFLLLACMMSV
jgi:hypothetical protein